MKNNFTLKQTLMSIALILLGISSNLSAQTLVKIGAAATNDYKTIQTAYDAIKTAAATTPITGAYVLELQSDYVPSSGITLETFPITLNAINGASVDNTITIKPATGAKITLSYPNQTIIAKNLNYNSATTSLVLADITGLAVGSYVSGPNTLYNTTFKQLTAVDASTNTVTFPAGTFNATKTNQSALFGAAQTKTIILDGAKYVIIDGVSRTDETTGLTIENPNSIYAQTIHLMGGSQYNTIKNCIVRGANQTSAFGPGVGATITFNTTSYNLITMNDICDMNDVNIPMPIAGIQVTAIGNNAYNTISENNFYNIENYICSGAANTGFIQCGSGGASNYNNMLNNKMYWTRTANFYSGTTVVGIGTGGSMSAAGNKFEGNTIGYANANGTGTATLIGSGATFKGVSAFRNTTCKNNIISNIDFTGANLTGIDFGTSGASTASDDACNGNTVQNLKLTLTASGTLSGITVNAANNYNSNIKNNIVRDLTVESATDATVCTVVGMNVVNSNPANKVYNYSGNQVYNLIAGKASSTAANVAIGIRTALNAATVEKNIVYNIEALSNSSLAVVNGIQTNTGYSPNQWVTATAYAKDAIVKNGYKVYKSTTTGTVTSGATIPSHTTGSVSDGAVTWAYQFAITPSSTTLKNNIVRIGVSANNNNSRINGISQDVQFGTSDVNKLYHNTVYIGGTAPASASQNSFAFYSAGSVVPTTNELQNNIFANQRTNTDADGTAKHYAIGFATAGVVKACDYNLYWANIVGLDGATDKIDLNAWKETVATGSDAGSLAGDPLFVDATSTSPDMHLTTGTPADQKGFDLSAVVTDDFYGSTRSDLSPSDIGAVAYYYYTTAVEKLNNSNENIYATNNSIIINNSNGQNVTIYSVTGKLVGSFISNSDNLIIPATKGFYIVSIGKERLKVLVN
jgi:hypothetical protein